MAVSKEQQAITIAIAYIKKAQSYLMHLLTQQKYKNDDMFSLKPEHEDVNPSYGFDDASNSILFDILFEHNFSCHVFSEEEHSWKIVGERPEFYVICDPFCNSFLASRTFREAAVAICISDLNGQLAACAIGDLQIKRIYYADQNGAYLLESYDHNSELKSKIRVSITSEIRDAFVVSPLLKSSRRKSITNLPFFHQAKIIHGVDGAIMIARLAAGYIDAYLDPIKGQPYYEVPCCELIIKAGGVVTDIDGQPFLLSNVISNLTKNSLNRYKFIAACNKNIHKELLDGLNFTKESG